MIKVVFKICLTTVCVMDHSQRGQAFIFLEPFVVSDIMCFLFLIFLPSWTQYSWASHFSILYFPLEMFIFHIFELRVPFILIYTQFLGGGSSAHKVSIKYVPPQNSKSIVPKVSTECGKEIPLYLICITKEK